MPGERDFWRLWLIGTLQFCVRWLDILVLGIFTYQKSGSAFLVTMLMMLRILPMAMFGVFTGAAADRFEGRTLIVMTLFTSLMTSSVLAALAHADKLAVWHVAVASFIGGIIWSMDLPLRRLMVGKVVSPIHTASAMALDAGASNASRMIGPAIGGAILAIWGIGGCFIFGMAMYAIAIPIAIGIRYRNPPHLHVSGVFLSNIVAAISLLSRDPRLAGYFAITIIFNLFGMPILSLVPVIGQDHLGLAPQGIGIFASMDGVGAVLGAIAIVYWAPPIHYAKLYVYSVAVYLAALIAMAVVPVVSLASLALVFAGAGASGFGIMQSTLIFRVIKPEMRGRMLGLLTVAIGTGPLGFIQTGLLADAVGAQLAIVISSGEGLIAMLLTQRMWRKIDAEVA